MDHGTCGQEDGGAYGLEEEEPLTRRSRPARIEECDTDNSELDRHQKPEEEKHGLEHRPSLRPEELVATRTEHEGIPCGDREGAHKKVFVGREVWGELQGVRKEVRTEGNV